MIVMRSTILDAYGQMQEANEIVKEVNVINEQMDQMRKRSYELDEKRQGLVAKIGFLRDSAQHKMFAAQKDFFDRVIEEETMQ